MANMELINTVPPLNIYDREWPLWTYQEQLPPCKFVFEEHDRKGMALESMVSGGCIISGAEIRKSVVFSNVNVRSYTYVNESVILPDVTIGMNCKIQKAIIDRGCHVPDGMEIGLDHEADKANGFRVTANGVVLVTRGMLGQEEGFA
jgi:glucose-1-phosphate adenylyltransferase